MSSVSNRNGLYFQKMFYGCTNLKTIRLDSFTKSYFGYDKCDMFKDIPKNISIIIHTNFYQSIKEQLSNEANISFIG